MPVSTLGSFLSNESMVSPRPVLRPDNRWDCILQIVNEGIYIDERDGTQKAYLRGATGNARGNAPRALRTRRSLARELHLSVKVDRSGQEPRLVAGDKQSRQQRGRVRFGSVGCKLDVGYRAHGCHDCNPRCRYRLDCGGHGPIPQRRIAATACQATYFPGHDQHDRHRCLSACSVARDRGNGLGFVLRTDWRVSPTWASLNCIRSTR